MNYAKLSTNCTKITVFVASFNACRSLFHILLLEGDAPLVLIPGECVNWKTAPSVLEKPTENCAMVVVAIICSEAGVLFFFCHCSFAIKFWNILIFLSMACSENLLNQICLIDRALTYKCASASFIVWRNIYAFLCFHFFPLKFSSFCGKIFNDLDVFPNGLLCCFFFAFAYY